jgi:hypothetical protein
MMSAFLLVISGVLHAVIGFAGSEEELYRSVNSEELGLRMLRERASLLQQGGVATQAGKDATNVRFFLGDSEGATTTAPAAKSDAITMAEWTHYKSVLLKAGASTPQPSLRNALNPNLPATPPPPPPWKTVMGDASQPLATQLGAAVMYGLSGKPTGTPPPSQAQTNAQFVAQCPMVLFHNNVSIRHSSCNDTQGTWVDISNPDPRSALRWRPIGAGGLFFGVDSAISGKGTVEFAKITQKITLTGFYFSLENCLGIERWTIQEEVYKVDKMGKVQTTSDDRNDPLYDAAGYFIRYNIYGPNGGLRARSTLFRTGANQVNFTSTTSKDPTKGEQVLGVANRRGTWKGEGWTACMSKTSPRAWDLNFPNNTAGQETVATVQDIRIAIAGAITLMAYRDEHRGKDGLNLTGQGHQWAWMSAAVLLFCIAGITICNGALIFVQSGVKEKLRKTFWDTEHAFFPKRPLSHHTPPMHPSW